MTKISTILVTGSGGQLGQSIERYVSSYPNYQFVFANRSQLDLSDSESITTFFKQQQFDLIINCAAYTAVDKAELEPDLADKINHLAIKKMAGIALQQGAKLIHISTDYVFDGQHYKPYIETDKVAPQSIYGLTKFKGEKALLQTMAENAIIIRTSWLYSEFGNNFVKTMLKLGQDRDQLNVVFDQIGTPTYAYDLAQAIMSIVESQEFKQAKFNSNIYHYSGEGVCSWYDFAKAIFEYSESNCIVNPIKTKDYPTPAARPHYSLLDKSKIKQNYGLLIPYWKDSLQHCLSLLQDKD